MMETLNNFTEGAKKICKSPIVGIAMVFGAIFPGQPIMLYAIENLPKTNFIEPAIQQAIGWFTGNPARPNNVPAPPCRGEASPQ